MDDDISKAMTVPQPDLFQRKHEITIGDTSAGYDFHGADPLSTLTIGSAQNEIDEVKGSAQNEIDEVNDILFVVYTERFQRIDSGKRIDITRLISARLATNFERGLYYGKHE